jgi:hypothetical protein
VSGIWERTRRRIQVEKNLFFEYEVSPHRAFLANVPAKDLHFINKDSNPQPTLANTGEPDRREVGSFIPFKQVRLQGQANPLRPPIHLETVLIGRALGQSTGYRSGVGFRIRDDGYVEAEFADQVRKYTSLAEFESDVASRVRTSRSD